MMLIFTILTYCVVTGSLEATFESLSGQWNQSWDVGDFTPVKFSLQPGHARRRRSIEGIKPPTLENPKVVIRQNIGVFAYYESSLNMASSSWLHMWKLNLPTVDLSFQSSITCANFEIQGSLSELQEYTRTLCKWAKFIGIALSSQVSHLGTIDLDLRDTINKAWGVLKPHSSHLIRSKRAPLQFIGEIQKALFGTATQDDLARIQKSNEAIRAAITGNTDAIELLKDKLVSTTDELSSQISDTRSAVVNLTQAMAAFANLTQVAFNKFDDDILRMSGYIGDGMAILGNVISKSLAYNTFALNISFVIQSYSDILEGLTDCAAGFLNPKLISPDALTKVINQVSISANSKGMYLSYQDLQWYYKQPLCSVLTEPDLAVLLKIPLFHTDTSIYELWKLKTYPVRLTPDSPIETSVIGLPDYVAVSTNPGITSMSVIQSSDLALCRKGEIYECGSIMALPTTYSEGCLQSILQSRQMKEVGPSCEFQMAAVNNLTSLYAVHLFETTWFIQSGETGWTISCPNQEQTPVPGFTGGIIQLPCYCSLRTHDLFVPAATSPDCSQSKSFRSAPTYNAWIAYAFPDLDFPKVLSRVAADTRSLPEWKEMTSRIQELKGIENSLSKPNDLRLKMGDFDTKMTGIINKVRESTAKIEDNPGESWWVSGMKWVSFTMSILAIIFSCTAISRTRRGCVMAPMLLLCICFSEGHCQGNNNDLTFHPRFNYTIVKGDGTDELLVGNTQAAEANIDLCHWTYSQVTLITVFISLILVMVFIGFCMVCVICYKVKKGLPHELTTHNSYLKTLEGTYVHGKTNIIVKFSVSIHQKLQPSFNRILAIHLDDINPLPHELIPGEIRSPIFAPQTVSLNHNTFSLRPDWPIESIIGPTQTYDLSEYIEVKSRSVAQMLHISVTKYTTIGFNKIISIKAIHGGETKELYPGSYSHMYPSV